MISNTSKYIPYECISSIMIEHEELPEYPFYSGTGFYSFFPPHEDIFFITAKHCILNDSNELMGKIKVSLKADGICKKAVIFKEILTGGDLERPDEIEDIAVLVVGDMSREDRNYIISKALRLRHQNCVNNIIDYIIRFKGNIRTVGFPSVSKDISYEESKAEQQPRGFHGKIIAKGEFKNWYRFVISNWKDGNLEGFSGSPILELIKINDKVLSVPIGVMVTESQFISINFATNLIANYINSKTLSKSGLL